MTGYVRIISWHVPSGVISRGGMIRTRCGKWADAGSTIVPELPLDEKSCETCLRLQTR